jgi:hypothetical protein
VPKHSSGAVAECPNGGILCEWVLVKWFHYFGFLV